MCPTWIVESLAPEKQYPVWCPTFIAAFAIKVGSSFVKDGYTISGDALARTKSNSVRNSYLCSTTPVAPIADRADSGSSPMSSIRLPCCLPPP